MAEEKGQATATADEKPVRHRSPSYPTVGLEDAAGRVKKFFDVARKAGAPPKLAAKYIGFATPHGQAMSVLSALKKFGLVAEERNRIVPTQRGIEIATLPNNDPRRDAALQAAVLSPVIYRKLLWKYKDSGLPTINEPIEAELVAYEGFNPNAVGQFVKDFRASLEFAGISDLSMLNLEPMEAEIEEKEQATTPKSKAKPAPLYHDYNALLGTGKAPSQSTRRYPLEISIPRNLKAELSISGDEFRKEDLERLKKQLDRLLENLEEAFQD